MLEFIPIGNPIKYHPIIIIIQTKDKTKTTGIIFFIVLIIPKFDFFSYLYINPIVIIRYIYIGEKSFPTESAAKNKVCVKDGEIFDLINSGTYIGEIIFHFWIEPGIIIDIITIVINANSINKKPEIFVDPTKSIMFVDITVEKFVQSIISYKIEEKKSNTKTYPVPSNDFVKALL